MARYIYFLQAGEAGPIKIGVATSIERRMRSLQAGNHLNLTLLAVIPRSSKMERLLHKKFFHIRFRGEWFRPTFELQEFIVKLPPPPFIKLRKTASINVANVEEAKKIWLDKSIRSNQRAALQIGVPAYVLTTWLGDSGRNGRALDPDQARKNGAKGGRKKLQLGMPEKKMWTDIFTYDKNVDAALAVSRKLGQRVSVATLRNKFGSSGRLPGARRIPK